jgi:predicted RNase H-like HicB family nuclease
MAGQRTHVDVAPRRTYTVLLLPDDDGFMVEVPALPGCFTQGATADETIERAKEAIRAHIAGLEADGELVPEDVPRAPILTLVSV